MDLTVATDGSRPPGDGRPAESTCRPGRSEDRQSGPKAPLGVTGESGRPCWGRRSSEGHEAGQHDRGARAEDEARAGGPGAARGARPEKVQPRPLFARGSATSVEAGAQCSLREAGSRGGKKAGRRCGAAAVRRRARSSGSSPTTTRLLNHHEETRARYVAAHETCRQSTTRTVERIKHWDHGAPWERKALTSGTQHPIVERRGGPSARSPTGRAPILRGAMRQAPGPSNRGRPVPVRREARRGGSVNPGSGRTAVQPRLAPSPRWAAAPSTGAVRCSS